MQLKAILTAALSGLIATSCSEKLKIASPEEPQAVQQLRRNYQDGMFTARPPPGFKFESLEYRGSVFLYFTTNQSGEEALRRLPEEVRRLHVRDACPPKGKHPIGDRVYEVIDRSKGEVVRVHVSGPGGLIMHADCG